MEGQQPEPTARNVFDEKVETVKQELEPEPTGPSMPDAKRYRWWGHQSLLMCLDCGSVVHDNTVHDRWHISIGQP